MLHTSFGTVTTSINTYLINLLCYSGTIFHEALLGKKKIEEKEVLEGKKVLNAKIF